MDVEPHNYLSAKRFFYGTEIIIHDPEDFPEKSLLTAFSQPGTDVSIAVLPSVVATEKDVESLPVNLRFCRFEYERPLQITKKYSFQSCITECRALTIFKTCGCIPFFYPAMNVSADQKEPPRQCNLKDVKCLADNRREMKGFNVSWILTVSIFQISSQAWSQLKRPTTSTMELLTE